jgi:peptide/nickel transport system ATP-binding protein
MSHLTIKNLDITFDTSLGPVKAVDKVSFELIEKETLALVGETGCGKSVIAHSVLRLLPSNAKIQGKILFKHQDLLRLSEKKLAQIREREIALVMQNPSLALNPVFSIGHQITEPLVVHKGMKKKNAKRTAKDLLKRLRFKGPDNAMRAYPHEMSGGMKQRILIGMAVILNPQIIIADEPTTGLDSRLRTMVLKELELVKEMGHSSMLFISHDLDAVKETSDRTAVMYSGEIIETGPTEEFFKKPLHPYSMGLLESRPGRGFKPIPGTSPSMIRPPEGCKFHPRCPYKKEICVQKKPDFVRDKNRDVKCVLYS